MGEPIILRPDGATLGLAAQIIFDVKETRGIRQYRPSVYQRGLEDFFFAFFWGRGLSIDDQAWAPYYNIDLINLIKNISSGEAIMSLDHTKSKGNAFFLNYPIEKDIERQLETLPSALISMPASWEILLLSDYASFSPEKHLIMPPTSPIVDIGHNRPFLTEENLSLPVPEEAISFALPRLREWFNPQISTSELKEFIRRIYVTHIASGWAYYLDCKTRDISFLSSATRSSLWLAQLHQLNVSTREALKGIFLPYAFSRFLERLPYDTDPETFVMELIDFSFRPTDFDRDAQEVLSKLIHIKDQKALDHEIVHYKTAMEKSIRRSNTASDQISFAFNSLTDKASLESNDKLYSSWWIRHFRGAETNIKKSIRASLENIFPHTFSSSEKKVSRKYSFARPILYNEGESEETVSSPSLIRIFLSSPSDVKAERAILQEVVHELNRTIAPDNNCFIQLLTFEENTYPAMGHAQQIINEQIGTYEIYIGIMWNRFGTPTDKAGSGTEEEFRDAYDDWKKDNDKPVMFYFSKQPMLLETKEQLDQRGKVIEFENELKTKGLIGYYENADVFADIVRPQLTLAIKSITNPPKDSTTKLLLPENINISKTLPANNCSLALAFGKQISTVNSIDSHSNFRHSLVKMLVESEQVDADAIVPIPHAGLFLATCWNEWRDERLWLALGHARWNSSMFRISSNTNDRMSHAEEKVGRLMDNNIAKSVILIDEAILSGVTMRKAAETLRFAGVERIYIRTLLPPVVNKCPYDVISYKPGSGFDKQWLGKQFDNQLIANTLGADDYRSLSIEEVIALGKPRALCVQCCDANFTM